MKNTRILCLLLIVSLLSAGAAAAQETTTLRFLCFQDGVECDVYAGLLARFSEDNPEISVAVDIAAAADILPVLAAQLEAGAPPDFARLPNLHAFRGHYLDLRPLLAEPAYLETGFDELIIPVMSGDSGDGGLYGYPDAAAVVAPFVNVSLFREAGLELPGGGIEPASWDEWLAALDKVVSATGASYVLSVDNKDHRLVGPAMSLGAEYFDEDGRLTLPDDGGLRDFLQILQGLIEAGKTPADTLLGTGKSQEYFVRGETLMYICGSWKAEEVAAQVGADFEWAIVPNPSGPGGSTGVAQLTALVAFADTGHPEAVGQVFDYLLAPETAAEFAARSLTVPANEKLLSAVFEYKTEDPAVSAALKAFAREVPRLQRQALALDLHPLAPVYYDASNTNLRQVFAGDLTLDEALAALREALLLAAAESPGK